MTWPLALHAATTLPGPHDPQLQAWVLAWDAHALRSNPLGVWQSPLFYPYPDTLAYQDHMLVLVLPVAPLLWLGASPALALNVLLLASYSLGGLAVYQLALELFAPAEAATSHKAAAFVAGVAFTFCAYRMIHIVHVNLQQIFWMAWALLFLIRTLRHSRWRDALLFGLFAGLQVANSVYYTFFALVALGLYVGIWALAALWRRLQGGERLPWRALAQLAGGGAVAGLLGIPFLLPYLRLYQSLAIVRSPREIDNWSAPLQAYLAVPEFNRLYGRLGALFQPSGGEFALFPGFVVAVLALIGVLAAGRNKAWRETAFLLVLAAGAFVLSLGSAVQLVRGGDPLPIPTPYPLLYAYLPGFGSLRVPSRWGLLVSLALALLAMPGLLALMRAGLRHRIPALLIAAVALAGVLAEQAAVPVPTTDPALLQAPPVYAWLGEPQQRDIGVVLELPVGRVPRGDELQRIVDRQYRSWQNFKSLPVSYGGLIPFGTTDILARVQGLPREDALRFLQFLGVDTLVIHADQYPADRLGELVAGLDQSALVRKRADIGNALVYSLVPAPEAQPPGDPGSSVYISNDERIPGVLALALSRRWAGAGMLPVGSGRPRYYAPFTRLAAGQVAEYGLLATSENPRVYGFDEHNRAWSALGLALFRRDPTLRASLTLGAPPPGAFHVRYPRQLEFQIDAGRARIGSQSIQWPEPLAGAMVEVDLASLTAQKVQAGNETVAIPAGASSVQFPAQPGARLQLSGQQELAILRVRVLAGSGSAHGSEVQAPAVAAQTSFEGSKLTLAAQLGGSDRVLFVAQGAAASDDHPVRLWSGELLAANGRASVAVDVLKPQGAWIAASEPLEDGRYIAYVKDAAHPEAPGLPVAQWTVRGGQIADAQAVPLPLTELR